MRLSGEIWSYVNGTSVPNLNDASLLDGKIVTTPSTPILLKFCKFVENRNSALFSGENDTLSQTRDLLLPKLMSGEIRLREAEKLVEAGCMSTFNENHVEEAAIAYLQELGYAYKPGPEIAPDTLTSERQSYGDVFLLQRLKDAIARLNPTIPFEAREDALRRLQQPSIPN